MGAKPSPQKVPLPDYRSFAEGGFNLESFTAKVLRFRGRTNFNVLGDGFGFRFVCVDSLAMAIRIDTRKIDFPHCFSRLVEVANAYRALPILLLDQLESEDIGEWTLDASARGIAVRYFQESTATLEAAPWHSPPGNSEFERFVAITGSNFANVLEQLAPHCNLIRPWLRDFKVALLAHAQSSDYLWVLERIDRSLEAIENVRALESSLDPWAISFEAAVAAISDLESALGDLEDACMRWYD